MSGEETKVITIELCVPVVVQLTVRWDPEDETAEIRGVSQSHIQSSACTVERIGEHLSDDDYLAIDNAAKEAFGIED